MNIHKDTFRKLADLGNQIGAYQPTFDFEGEFINSSHRYFSNCPVNDNNLIQMSHRLWSKSVVRGYLLREDALKLYELAYFVQGNILEIGSYHGLSTCILSQANQDSPYRKRLISVDLSPKSVLYATCNLYTMGLKRDVKIMWAEAANKIQQFAQNHSEFEFVFIDHAHGYSPVYAVCCKLRSIVKKGGFCLFHDFNDPANKDPKNIEYKVYQAVIDGLKATDFEFYGIYGCTALYRAI